MDKETKKSEEHEGKSGSKGIGNEPDKAGEKEQDDTSESQEDEESVTGTKEKGPSRKKRMSFMDYISRRPSTTDVREQPPKERRQSFVRGKLLALEKQLTMDNIHRKATGVFHPENTEEVPEKKTETSEHEDDRVYISPTMAVFYMLSAFTGSAIMGLPFYLRQSSWFGVFLMMLLGLNSLYSGLCLSWSWNIMEKQWPEYSGYTRIPYQHLAYRAVGTWMKYIVAITLDITQLGICASYISGIADVLESVIHKYINFCPVMIIAAICLCPLTFFASYRNIKLVGILDVSCSILFTLLTTISFFYDKEVREKSDYSDPTFKSFITAFASMSYAYGIGGVIPSIMVDMADRRKFPEAVVTAYLVLIALYIMFPILGYAAYGDNTPYLILQPVLTKERFKVLGPIIAVIQAVQLATTFVVSILPSTLAFEERFKCPDKFGCFRVYLRMTIVLAMLLVVLEVPYISKFMDLIGASTMNLLTFIFPPIFYVLLVRQQEGLFVQKNISIKEMVLVAEILLLGICVGCLATYVTIDSYFASRVATRSDCYHSMYSEPESKPWLKTA